MNLNEFINSSTDIRRYKSFIEEKFSEVDRPYYDSISLTNNHLNRVNNHHSVLRNLRYSPYKLIPSKLELWHNRSTIVSVTPQKMEVFGYNYYDIHQLIKKFKTLDEAMTHLGKRLNSSLGKIFKDFTKSYKSLVISQPIVESSEFYGNITRLIHEEKSLLPYEVKKAASIAYLLKINSEDFNVLLGYSDESSKIKDLCVVIESRGVYIDWAKSRYKFLVLETVSSEDLEKLLNYNESQLLHEASRAQILNKSKRDGKVRMDRRLKYKDRSREIQFVFYNYLKLYGSLRFMVSVGNYTVRLEMRDFATKLRKYKVNNSIVKFDYKSMVKAVSWALDNTDLTIHCTCPDFKYRFAYWTTQLGTNAGDPEFRPSKITNPDDKLGSACKHVLAALSNKEWSRKLVPHVSKFYNKHPNLLP